MNTKKTEPIICLKLFPAHFLNIKIGSFKPRPDIILELLFGRLIKKGGVARRQMLINDDDRAGDYWELNRCLFSSLKTQYGCVRLGNLDLDFKIRISDLQTNAKSESGFQRWDTCSWIPFLSAFLLFFFCLFVCFFLFFLKSEKRFDKQFLRTAVLHVHSRST